MKIPMIGVLGESLAGLRLFSWACQRHAPRIRNPGLHPAAIPLAGVSGIDQ